MSHLIAPCRAAPSAAQFGMTLTDIQKEAADLCARPKKCAMTSPDVPPCRIYSYFNTNSRPVNLDGLLQLLSPEVVVDYPSGRFVGRDSYMAHQVRLLPLRLLPNLSSHFAVAAGRHGARAAVLLLVIRGKARSRRSVRLAVGRLLRDKHAPRSAFVD
jgi:hypothetical protein